MIDRLLDRCLEIRLAIDLLVFAPNRFHVFSDMGRKWAVQQEESLRDKRGGARASEQCGAQEGPDGSGR